MKTTKFLSNLIFILILSGCVSLKSADEISAEDKAKQDQQQKEETPQILADLLIKNKAMELL